MICALRRIRSWSIGSIFATPCKNSNVTSVLPITGSSLPDANDAHPDTPLPAARLPSLAWRQRSCSHELLPKNSNNSPRHTISQNNSIVISVCTLACAARFRANTGSKSVGMVRRRHAHPSCAETTLTGPLQFPYRTRIVGKRLKRPGIRPPSRSPKTRRGE